MYSPQFTIKDRDGKKSLWVTMPDGYGPWNIWDLTSPDDATLKAIIHAFELGMRAHKNMLSLAVNYFIDDKWAEE